MWVYHIQYTVYTVFIAVSIHAEKTIPNSEAEAHTYLHTWSLRTFTRKHSTIHAHSPSRTILYHAPLHTHSHSIIRIQMHPCRKAHTNTHLHAYRYFGIWVCMWMHVWELGFWKQYINHKKNNGSSHVCACGCTQQCLLYMQQQAKMLAGNIKTRLYFLENYFFNINSIAIELSQYICQLLVRATWCYSFLSHLLSVLILNTEACTLVYDKLVQDDQRLVFCFCFFFWRKLCQMWRVVSH